MKDKEQTKLTTKRIRERLDQKKGHHKILSDKLSAGVDQLTVAELTKLISECENMADAIDEFEAMLSTESEHDIRVRKLEDQITILENKISDYVKIYGELKL